MTGRRNKLKRNRHIIKNKIFKDKYVRHFFLLPALIVISIIVIFPILYNLLMSMNFWFAGDPAGPKWVGFKNYLDMLGDERFFNSLRVTVLFTAGALFCQVILGVALAIYFHKKFFGKEIVKTIFLFPIAATPVAVSLIWGMMFNYDLGVINQLLSIAGIEPQLWLADPDMVIPSLIITDTWQWTPLVMLIVLSGLESLPDEPFESAYVDGANMFRIIYHITIPMVRPTIITAVMIRSIDAIKTFDLIYVMTQGGPDIASENLNLYIFQKGFSYFRMGSASAMAIVLFSIVLLFNVILAVFRRRSERINKKQVKTI
jgi:multiple sugar transport system permease protein